jgi:flagellar motor switch protein FliM
MSQDFLSQEEVDALLKGVTGETDETPAEEASTGVKTYDLGRQERIVRGRMPTMELINERFARYLRIGLFNFMHRNAEISVGPVRVQKYSDFIRNLVVPTNLNLVQVKPLRGTGLIVLDPNLVFLVVDNLFGSDGRFHTRVEGRDFTLTEQRIIMSMLEVVFAELEKAWKPVYEITFEYMRSEMNTQFANVATPSEIVVAFTFTVDLSGNSAEMHVCLPYSMIEPIRDVLYSTMHSEQAGSDQRWSGNLLGKADLHLGDIARLKVGDVVPIEISDSVTVQVDGVPLIDCRYGVNNGQYALKIEKFVSLEQAE